jgi:hypothetical protein
MPVLNFSAMKNGSVPSLETGGGGGDNGDMDALIRRVDRLEETVVSIRDTLARLEPRITETHTFVSVVLPTLATKVEQADILVQLAEKPGKLYLWTMAGVLIAVAALGAVFGPILQKALP